MRILALVLLTGLAIEAQAAGFALNEQSTSGLGNSFAGGAASAEDASSQFFNPASMTYLPDSQIVVAVHAIRPSANFSNNGSRSAASTLTPGGDGGDPGAWAFVPNIYYTKALNETIRLGLSINAPFGLKTDYEKDWVGRYQGIKSDLSTLNINPSVAFKLNDRLSWGLGVSAMQARAELTSAINLGALIPGASDGAVQIKGDDWGFGWNTGMIFQLTEDTRLGLAYRSKVHQTLEGNVNFGNVPPLLAFADSKASAKITMPDTFSASVFHRLNKQWDVMADATWTNWSSFQDLTAIRTNGVLSGSIIASTPHNWQDTMRYAFGATYHYDEKLKFRTGVSYDETPVGNRMRTARIPDNDRISMSFGVSYRYSANSTFDLGYSHLFLRETSINKRNDTDIPALADTLTGHYNTRFDSLSLQYVYTF
ncbi:MAG TPA: outer membrane protein transport protein [Methylophilaceae bacterium]|nr:outer membrane protein transport protein [Methylophilaceae bacterium]